MSAVVKMLEGEMSIAPPPNPYNKLRNRKTIVFAKLRSIRKTAG
jgi:hypothetical protein